MALAGTNCGVELMSPARIWHRLPTPDIHAERFTGDNILDIWNAFENSAAGIYGPTPDNPNLVLTTIQGDKVPCRIGDWVIAEEACGRFYPCQHEVFIERYAEGPSA